MQLIQSNSLTMSSLELLGLVNTARNSSGENPVRHSDFCQRCADELDGEHYEISVVQNSNKTETTVIHMSADQCKLVAMRESKSVRRAVLDRLNSLESAQAPKLPQTFSEALRLAAEQAEQIEQQQLLIEQQKPAVEFVDKYVDGTGLKGFRQVAKLLQAKEHQFREFLVDQKIQYRLGGEWCAYQNHIEAGRFEIKTGTAQNSEHVFNEAKFTPKGVNWIAGLWAQHNIKSGEA